MSTLKVNAITETDGSAFPFGKILQAKCTPSNDLAQATTSGDTYIDITGLDLTFTPLLQLQQ